MGVTSLTTKYMISTANNDAGDVDIMQIEELTLSPGLQHMMSSPSDDGLVDSTYIAVDRRETRMTGTTSRVGTVLASVGISGLQIEGTTAAVTMFIQEYQLGGARKSGSSHTKLSWTDGIIIPTTLTVPATGHATLGFEMVPISTDGTTDPITVTGSSALTGTPTTDELFRLGKVSINGSDVAGLVSATINFGINLVIEYGDGAIYPTFVAIDNRQPTIEMTFKGSNIVSTIGFDGLAQGATDSVLYLRKVSEGAKTVSDGTGEHISFTIDEGRYHIESIEGQPYDYRVICTPTYDGTNAIMAISTSATIS